MTDQEIRGMLARQEAHNKAAHKAALADKKRKAAEARVAEEQRKVAAAKRQSTLAAMSKMHHGQSTTDRWIEEFARKGAL